MAEVTVKGLKRLIKKLDKLGLTTEKVMQEALVISAEKVQREARLLISTGSPSGRFYGKHRASAEGEAPAANSGDLGKAIDFEEGSRVVKVGILDQKAIYGAYLEFGTSTIAPRPWLKPATDMSKDFIKKSFSIALKKNIKKVL